MKTISCKGRLSLCFILISVLSTAGSACLADSYSPDPNSVSYAPVIGSGNMNGFDVSGLQVAQNTQNTTGGIADSGAAQGDAGGQTYATNEAPAQKTYGNSANTSNQRIVSNPTSYVPLDKVYGGGGALPPTSMDSFVYNAAGSADLIYGDEGTTSIPPFFGFDESHRINAGIYQGGLTTGHASALPEAWGWPN